MIIRLLVSDSGMISKGKQVMWNYIEAKLIPLLSQAAVDARAEEYSRRLATVAAELAVLCEQEQQLAENTCDSVETTGDDGTNPVDEIMEVDDMQDEEPAGSIC